MAARVDEQFDAVIYLDHTRALERASLWDLAEPPETYPIDV